MPTNWMNADNLYVKFGTNKSTVTIGGAYNESGPYNVVEIKLTGTALAASQTIVSDVIILPEGARIDKVETVTETAWDSAADNTVLNVGLMKVADRLVYDADGLIAALPQASMDPAGEFQDIKIGHTYVGSAIGTTLTEPCYITADYDTAAATAGIVRVRIFYRMLA